WRYDRPEQSGQHPESGVVDPDEAGHRRRNEALTVALRLGRVVEEDHDPPVDRGQNLWLVAALQVEDTAAARRVRDVEPHQGSSVVVEPEAIGLTPDPIATDLERPDDMRREVRVIEQVFEHVIPHEE